MRKALVSVLILCVILGVGASAFAATTTRTHVFSDVTNEDQAFYLDFLGSLNIFRGDVGAGGPARPGDTITRAEFSVVVVRMMGREGLATMMADMPLTGFSDAGDIPAWALGAMNLLVGMEVLQGSGDLLRPNDPVTGAEALAMLTRALGNDSGVAGVWPMNYMMWGYDNDLLDETAAVSDWTFIAAGVPITRAQMAFLAYNGLFCGTNYHEGDFDDPLSADFFTSGAILDDYDLEESTVFFDPTVDLAETVTLYGGESFNDLMYLGVAYAVNADGEIVWLGTDEGGTISGTFYEWVFESAPWDPGEEPEVGYYSVLDDEDYNEDGDLDDLYIRLDDEDGELVEVIYDTSTMFSLNGGDPVELDIWMILVERGALLGIVVDENGAAAFVDLFQYLGCFYLTDGLDDTDAEDDYLGCLTLNAHAPLGTVNITTDTILTGDVTSWDDLAENDIVYPAMVDLLSDEVYALRVVRQTHTGVISDVVVSYPGEVMTVEFEEADDLTVAGTYDGAFTDYYGENPTDQDGQEWVFYLDYNGEARLGSRTTGAQAQYPIVKLIGYQDRSVNDRLTVMDYTGATSTYVVSEALNDHFSDADLDQVFELAIAGRDDVSETEGATVDIGEVYDYASVFAVGGHPGVYEIYAVDAEEGQLTVGYYGEYLFITNEAALVFEIGSVDVGSDGDPSNDVPNPGEIGDHVGLAGLEVGDLVNLVTYVATGSVDEDFWLIELLWDVNDNGEVWDEFVNLDS